MMVCEGQTRYYASYACRGDKWKWRPCKYHGTKHLVLTHRDKIIFDGYLCGIHRKRKVEAYQCLFDLKVEIS